MCFMEGGRDIGSVQLLPPPLLVHLVVQKLLSDAAEGAGTELEVIPDSTGASGPLPPSPMQCENEGNEPGSQQGQEWLHRRAEEDCGEMPMGRGLQQCFSDHQPQPWITRVCMNHISLYRMSPLSQCA